MFHSYFHDYDVGSITIVGKYDDIETAKSDTISMAMSNPKTRDKRFIAYEEDDKYIINFMMTHKYVIEER